MRTFILGKARFFFVSSEKGPDDVRAYTTRYYEPETGDIGSVGEFQGHSTLRSAKVAALKESERDY